MCRAAGWLLASCLFLTVGSCTGKVSKPENLSLTWIDEFNPQLTWASQQHLMTACSYTVAYKITEDSRTRKMIKTTNWTDQVIMNGGFLNLSVTTDCNGTLSEPSVINNTYPVLVKSWTCYIYSRSRSNCSWEPASDASNISFYYRLGNEGGIKMEQNDSGPSPILECPSYKYIKGMRHGCALEASYNQRIYILFSEMRNNTVSRNTFQMALWNNVRPPPLNWTVRKTENKFSITWSPPDIDNNGKQWKYLINYTECKETKTISVDGTSYLLDRVSRCPYRMSIKAKHEGSETPWSEEKQFGADTDPNMLVYAAFIIPLMFAGLAVLIFRCCRKNKENIFPKVPQPRDLLSDISDNNNKSPLFNMYVPAKEEENCNITLVIDAQVSKPNGDNLHLEQLKAPKLSDNRDALLST